MGRLIDIGLEQLSVMLCRLGSSAYEAVSLALRSCLKGNDSNDRIVDLSGLISSMAEDAENKGFELISRFQPVASDLRVIKSYMKIAYDFARYGRYALDISYICKRVISLSKCEEWMISHIMGMSQKVLEMVKISIDSLKNHDEQIARSISSLEKEVDEEYFGFLDRLTKDALATNKCTVAGVLVVRYIERIADHAVYICESLVYVVSGEKVSLG